MGNSNDRPWRLSVLLLAACAMANAQETTHRDNGICQAKIESVQRCHWIEGSMAIYNGTPSIRIRQRGSKRMYAVGPAEQEWMPSELKSKLTVDNAIDARFRICPIYKEKQKGLSLVCVDKAKIVNIRNGR